MPTWVRGLQPQLQRWFLWLFQIAQQRDPTARVSSARRSGVEQAKLYRRYLAGLSQYPVAPPGRSLHEQGRAIDIVARPETLRWLGQQWTTVGGKWGGSFGSPDPIHFEV